MTCATFHPEETPHPKEKRRKKERKFYNRVLLGKPSSVSDGMYFPNPCL